MPQTPNSADTPYVTHAEVLDFYAKDIIADLLRTPQLNYPPPSYLAILDPDNYAYKKLLKHMMTGAGQIEAACGIAKRYDKLDLQALTGASAALLQKLNAGLAVWSLSQLMKPMTARVEDVPMAAECMKLLEELRDGAMIFSYYETQEAGLPKVIEANPGRLLTPNVVGQAIRLFPNYGLNRLVGGGN